jgi:hypothetical protein
MKKARIINPAYSRRHMNLVVDVIEVSHIRDSGTTYYHIHYPDSLPLWALLGRDVEDYNKLKCKYNETY